MHRYTRASIRQNKKAFIVYFLANRVRCVIKSVKLGFPSTYCGILTFNIERQNMSFIPKTNQKMLLNCDTYVISSHNFNFKLETLHESAHIYRTFKSFKTFNLDVIPAMAVPLCGDDLGTNISMPNTLLTK